MSDTEFATAIITFIEQRAVYFHHMMYDCTVDIFRAATPQTRDAMLQKLCERERLSKPGAALARTLLMAGARPRPEHLYKLTVGIAGHLGPKSAMVLGLGNFRRGLMNGIDNGLGRISLIMRRLVINMSKYYMVTATENDEWDEIADFKIAEWAGKDEAV